MGRPQNSRWSQHLEVCECVLGEGSKLGAVLPVGTCVSLPIYAVVYVSALEVARCWCEVPS